MAKDKIQPHYPPYTAIVTGHEAQFDAASQEPSVSVACVGEVPQRNDSINILMSGFYHSSCTPAQNDFSLPSDTDAIVRASSSTFIFSKGTNLRLTEFPPHGEAPMHRTSTLDYNIITHGSITLVTPSFPSDSDGKPKLTETHAKVGDVVVQRGTLHAWRAGPQGCKFYTVVVDAVPVEAPASASGIKSHVLEPCVPYED